MNRVIIFGRIDYKDKRAINLAREAYIKYAETMARMDLAFHPTALFGEELEEEIEDATHIEFERKIHELTDKSLHNTLASIRTLADYAIAGTVFIYVLEVGELPASETISVKNDKSISHAYHAGMEAAEAGDYESAVKQFSKAIKKYPGHAWAVNERGLAQLELGNVKEAEADFNLAKELYPKLPNPHYGLARLYKSQGKFAAAIDSCERAIAGSIPHQPGHWLTAFLQSEVYLELLEQSADLAEEEERGYYKDVRLVLNRYASKLKQLGKARNKYYPTPEDFEALKERFEGLPSPVGA